MTDRSDEGQRPRDPSRNDPVMQRIQLQQTAGVFSFWGGRSTSIKTSILQGLLFLVCVGAVVAAIVAAFTLGTFRSSNGRIHAHEGFHVAGILLLAVLALAALVGLLAWIVNMWRNRRAERAALREWAAERSSRGAAQRPPS